MTRVGTLPRYQHTSTLSASFTVHHHHRAILRGKKIGGKKWQKNRPRWRSVQRGQGVIVQGIFLFFGHTVFLWCITSGPWCASGWVPVNKCPRAKLTMVAEWHRRVERRVGISIPTSEPRWDMATWFLPRLEKSMRREQRGRVRMRMMKSLVKAVAIFFQCLTWNSLNPCADITFSHLKDSRAETTITLNIPFHLYCYYNRSKDSMSKDSIYWQLFCERVICPLLSIATYNCKKLPLDCLTYFFHWPFLFLFYFPFLISIPLRKGKTDEAQVWRKQKIWHERREPEG